MHDVEMRGPIHTFNKHVAPYGSDLANIIQTSGVLVSNPTLSHTFTPSTPAKKFSRLKITHS